jgi:hypothetical protein
VTETTDLIFALDSIPAWPAVTRDPFLVYVQHLRAARIALGLFRVGGAIRKPRFLRIGLGIILLFAAKCSWRTPSGFLRSGPCRHRGRLRRRHRRVAALRRGPGAAAKAPSLHARRSDPRLRPEADKCAECVRSGDRWVDLRMCLSCGNVACCDSSKNRHATKHFDATGHPIMRSIEPGENWKWCYVDRVMVD